MITQAFQPPLYWQQFEDLTAAVFTYIYGDPKPHKFGRPGQAQNGVDVFGQWVAQSKLIGIQCKRLEDVDSSGNPLPGGAITEKILLDEYKKALDFSPKLDYWILATTAKTDARMQRKALELSLKSRTNGKFNVSIWYWDTFVTDLNRYKELQEQYYHSVLNIHNAQDQDRVILDLYGQAFERSAFRDSITMENPKDFLQALKDTQQALNTGVLIDRQSRHIIRKTIGGRRSIDTRQWRDGCEIVYSKLQALKEAFSDGMANKDIQDMGSYLLIKPQLQSELEKLRRQCIDEMNTVLQLAGLPPI